MILERLINSGLLAQAAASNGWADILLKMDKDKLVLMLIFGTGLICGIGYAISTIIRAANGSPDDSEDLKAQVNELQQRVATLERIVERQSSAV